MLSQVRLRPPQSVSHFTLMTASGEWAAAGRTVARKLELPIDVIEVDKDVTFPREISFERSFGVGPKGASLIRPDGVVGWRSASPSEAPVECLCDAVSQILGLASERRTS